MYELTYSGFSVLMGRGDGLAASHWTNINIDYSRYSHQDKNELNLK